MADNTVPLPVRVRRTAGTRNGHHNKNLDLKLTPFVKLTLHNSVYTKLCMTDCNSIITNYIIAWRFDGEWHGINSINDFRYFKVRVSF